MKIKHYILGVVFGLFLFSSARAQVMPFHMSHDNMLEWSYSNNRNWIEMPALNVAVGQGGGAWFYPEDGSIVMDNNGVCINMESGWTYDPTDFQQALNATGDFTLAWELVAGLLTPAEEDEAMWGGMLGRPAGSGRYEALNGWSSPFGFYSNIDPGGGGGGGGYQN